MREDIVGMLKNAVERGGRPERIAQSLINSGYNAREVQDALAYITGGTLASLNAPQQQPLGVRPIAQPLQMPPVPVQQVARPLPIMKEHTGPGVGKLVLLIFVLLLLVGGLVATIIFKDTILNIFS